MSEVRVIIDDIEVIGNAGMTVVEAAEKVGIKIPTMCHIRGLMPTGSCRVCVVEIEGMNRLVGSCHTPITDGMVVRTQSPKVMRARKTILQLMLAGHTGPCVNDTGAVRCELRRILSEVEVGPPAFQVRQAREYVEEKTSPYVRRDLSKCIRCGRCVQVCNEIAQQKVFGVGYRGFRSKIIVDCDTILNKEVCRDCGICIDYCPTSALTLPDGTKKEEAKKDQGLQADVALIYEDKGRESLLKMLQEAQKEFGYVPEKFIKEMAASLNMSVSEVYGVASFYSFLSLRPLGRNVIRVCGSLPCYIKGSQIIIEGIRKEIGIEPGETTADGRFSLEVTNCIGACDVAPAMLVNEDLHGNLGLGNLMSILERYK